jgi:hypothetical protein
MALIKCPECGNKVSTAASACPSCGHPIAGPLQALPSQPMQKKEPGCLAQLIVGVGLMILLIWFIGYVTGGGGTSQTPQKPTTNQSAPNRSDAANPAAAAKLENNFLDCVAKGAIYSFEPDKQIIRIEPLIWDRMSLTLKNDMIASLFLYYHYKGHDRGVQILSSRNDEVFAEWSVWSGTKIIR